MFTVQGAERRKIKKPGMLSALDYYILEAITVLRMALIKALFGEKGNVDKEFGCRYSADMCNVK